MVLKKIPFSSETKRIVRDKQNWKCAICNKKGNILIYVRKDGNNFNNDITNCLAICPSCNKTSWM